MPSPAALASPAAFPTPMDMGVGPELPIWPYLIQLTLVTAVVAAMGYYVLKLLRDKVPGLGLALAGARSLRVVERAQVDQNRMVFIIGVGKRYWLLAASGDHVTPVAELDAADVEADFAQLVEKESQRGGTP